MKKKQFIDKVLNFEVEEKIIMHFRNFHCDTRFLSVRGDKQNYGYCKMKFVEANYNDGFNLNKNQSYQHSLPTNVPYGYKGGNYDTIIYAGDYKLFSVTKVDGCLITGKDPAENRFDIDLLDLTYMFENTKLVFENIPRIKILKVRASQKEMLNENFVKGVWKLPNIIDRIEVV